MSWQLFEKLIDSAETLVLSTASQKAKPQCATILFAYHDNLFYFYTFNDSRKYANLQENPAVSMVLQTDEGYAQIDGIAQELKGDDAKLAKSLIIERKKSQSGYDKDPRCCYFSIKPTWIRLMTKTSYPAEYELLLG